MITYEMSVSVGGLIYFIHSVYVSPEVRKKGVFRTIYNAVVDKARRDPIGKCVRLYVELENQTAQSVYSALGMAKMDHLNFYENDFVFRV